MEKQNTPKKLKGAQKVDSTSLAEQNMLRPDMNPDFLLAWVQNREPDEKKSRKR